MIHLDYDRWHVSATRLSIDEINIYSVTAYLRYLIDYWSIAIGISNMPEILGTLYNLGEKEPHSSPISNNFGNFIASVYNYLQKVLYLGVNYNENIGSVTCGINGVSNGLGCKCHLLR